MSALAQEMRPVREAATQTVLSLDRLVGITEGWTGAECEQCVVSAITKARLAGHALAFDDLLRSAARIIPWSIISIAAGKMPAAIMPLTAAPAADVADVPTVVIGGGWQMAAFPGGIPAKESLDAIVSDRPVYLPNRDGHGAWVNSKALELAGITKDTPNPIDTSVIGHDSATGEPDGARCALVGAAAARVGRADQHRRPGRARARGAR